MLNENTFIEEREAFNKATNTDVLELDLPWDFIEKMYDEIVTNYPVDNGYTLDNAVSIFLTILVEEHYERYKIEATKKND